MVSKIKRLPTLAKVALLLLVLLLLLAAILLLIFLVPRHRTAPLPPATPPGPAPDNCSDRAVAFDFSPFLVQYKGGCVHRMDGTARVPAGVDAATGVISKDVAPALPLARSAPIIDPPHLSLDAVCSPPPADSPPSRGHAPDACPLSGRQRPHAPTPADLGLLIVDAEASAPHHALRLLAADETDAICRSQIHSKNGST